MAAAAGDFDSFASLRRSGLPALLCRPRQGQAAEAFAASRLTPSVKDPPYQFQHFPTKIGTLIIGDVLSGCKTNDKTYDLQGKGFVQLRHSD